MPRDHQSILFKLGAAFLIALLLLLLPILIPIAAICAHLEERKIKKLARQCHCLCCGAVLGDESIRLTDAPFATEAAERRKKFPRVKFRIVRNVHAICLKCGAQHQYRKTEHTFTLTPEPAHPQILPKQIPSSSHLQEYP
jgi:hypothetical protein